MVKIKNSQKKITIDEKQAEKTTKEILEILGYSDFDIGIWFTTNQTIRKYNRAYRKKDKPTDILAFQFHPEAKAGQKIAATSDDEKNLGDLIISLEYAKKDAVKLGKPLEAHLKKLIVHGICHLIGYTHETEQNYKKMAQKEKQILDGLKNKA